MFFHVIVTDDCNLCCSYCRAKIFDVEDDYGKDPGDIDTNIPESIAYPLDNLYKFLSKDPDPVLTFIGGEPLVRSDLVMEIMDNAPVKRYMIQTNGTLLAKLPSEYVNKFETILISVDGSENLTDTHRGNGVYNTVISTCNLIRENGYTGELIARMTVAEDTDIYESVTHLSKYFTSIHWQMDANFSGDYSRRNYSQWMVSYNRGIHKLVSEWVDRIETTGIIPKWYPFLSTTEDILLGTPSKLRCGSGYTNYSIMTNGCIIPCPIMIGMADYYVGHINESDPLNLPKVSVGDPCPNCDIYSFCGGRCLYSNIVQPWGSHYTLVCDTIRELKTAIMHEVPRLNRLINMGTITMDSFKHTRYNGCEIIP